MGIQSDISKRLKYLKMVNNYVTEDIVLRTGLNPITIKKYEEGKFNQPTLSIIIEFADLYEVSVDYILGRCELDESTYEMNIKTLQKLSYEKFLRRGSTTPIRLQFGELKTVTPGWPYDLVDDINEGAKTIEVPLTDTQITNLDEVIKSELSDREGRCIFLYYKDEKTLNEIADIFSVTRERIRQIIARGIRKLRHPARWKKIVYGFEVEKYNSQLVDLKIQLVGLTTEIEEHRKLVEDSEKLVEELNAHHEKVKENVSILSLAEMDLSVRSYNCLMRFFSYHPERLDYRGSGRIDTVVSSYDIYKLFTEKDEKKGVYTITQIRNLGRHSIAEIAEKLITLGYPYDVLSPWAKAVM